MPHVEAVLDHVAIAVPDAEAAAVRWRDHLGGRLIARWSNDGFATRQLRYAGGGKLELLSPPAAPRENNFVVGFLRRFGAAVHHVILKVGDLPTAIRTVGEGGFETVDVRLDDPDWREAFLRPSQTGGIVVQLGSTSRTDTEWAEVQGLSPQPVPPGAARFLGAHLRHPDLDAARRLWTLLGADVAAGPTSLRCAWPDSPLTILVTEGAPAGPVALRFAGAGSLPADGELGPAVEAGQVAA